MTEHADRVAAVRRFNRFYTRRIGVLGERRPASEFSLGEARVLYELAQRDDWSAAALGRELAMDAGYLSRVLQGLERAELIARSPTREDRRRNRLTLTEQGRAAFDRLDRASRTEVGALLERLAEPERDRLTAAMAAIERLLGEPAVAKRPLLVLRPHRPGDMGWILQRHGELYARDYGWSDAFERLVAEIVAGFLGTRDAQRERCWLAELDGERVGSVFLVRESDRVARLRLLLVEPAARGQGIGERLVDTCLRFAADAGYAAVTLWTNHVLDAARRIYERKGFRLVAEERHRRFGPELIGQTWWLDLPGSG